MNARKIAGLIVGVTLALGTAAVPAVAHADTVKQVRAGGGGNPTTFRVAKALHAAPRSYHIERYTPSPTTTRGTLYITKVQGRPALGGFVISKVINIKKYFSDSRKFAATRHLHLKVYFAVNYRQHVVVSPDHYRRPKASRYVVKHIGGKVVTYQF